MTDQQKRKPITPTGPEIRNITNQLRLFVNEQDPVSRVAREHHPDYYRWIDAAQKMLEKEPAPAYMHSALCAMSLPARKPKDDTKPVIRKDGKYSLLITPKQFVENGEWTYAGVPYGVPPRLILPYITKTALLNNSPVVPLGSSMADWMRKLGYNYRSGGPRGNYTAITEQMLRVSRSEFTISYEGEKESLLSDVQVSNKLVLWDLEDGRRRFVQDIQLSQEFFYSIKEHAVPLDENALAYLKGNVAALDLYTWAAYRLYRLDEPMLLSWHLLRQNFGSSAKQNSDFRKTILRAIPMVQVAYPDARIEAKNGGLYVEPSKPPIQQTLIGFEGGKKTA